jgi:hypothetical protein
MFMYIFMYIFKISENFTANESSDIYWKTVRVKKNFYTNSSNLYRGADKSLARPTSRYILFYGENIYFDTGLVLYI